MPAWPPPHAWHAEPEKTRASCYSAQLVVARFRRELILLALVGVPLAAALHGATNPGPVRLRLGPGDGPYVRGFAREYEIYENDAIRWSSLDSSVELPLTLEGPITLAYRFSRPVAEAGRAEVTFGGTVVDTFETRNRPDERRVSLETPGAAPLAVRFRVETAEPRGLGLRLDWVRFDGETGSRLRLRGPARFRAALLVLLLILIFRVAGWTSGESALLVAPFSLVATLGLLVDPWLVHRLLTSLPEWLLVVGLGGVLFGAWLRARGLVDAPTLRMVAALAVTAFVLRAALLNHPDYYYPDLRTHVRLVQLVRKVGFEFFHDPATYIVKHGAWSRVIDGQTFAFPYSVVFHSLFALTSLSYDELITAVKLGATLATVVPIVALWSLGRRFGASPLGPVLMLLAPVYVHHLGLAYLAALFGNAVDMIFMAWLARHWEGLGRPWTFVAAAALVAASTLSYVAAVIMIPIFLGVLASTVLAERSRPDRSRLALLLLCAGALGTISSLLLYYRGFSPLFTHALTRAATDVPLVASGDAAPRTFPAVLWTFTESYFGKFFQYTWAPAGLVGFVLLVRPKPDRPFVLAWGLTYLALSFGRAHLPFVFQHPHESLFVMPLVCLGAGEAVAQLHRGETPWRRLAAIAVFAALAIQGLVVQWTEWSRHLGRAL